MGHPTAPFAAEMRATHKLAAVDARAWVDPGARVSEDCVIKSGAYVCAGVTLEKGTYVGANTCFVEPPNIAVIPPTLVKAGAWIGPNATIHAGLTIGSRAIVQPGAVVTRSVPPSAIVEGNPASIVGYAGVADHVATPVLAIGKPAARPSVQSTPVKGVTVHHFAVIPDLRGNLTAGEFDRQVPFRPMRYFLVFDVPNREVRGEHAHRQCHQFLICLRGNCAVVADDGINKVEVQLTGPALGLYLPPMTWGVQYKYSPDAMLMVFASDYYDSADYVREYDVFQQLVEHR